MAPKSTNKSMTTTIVTIADAASWWCALILVTLLLIATFKESSLMVDHIHMSGNNLTSRPCDEIYVVGEGETLHTISDKCGDPYIVEQNPHIHDPDDVFPGLVIKITPTRPAKLLR
ncbi:peptidoglycan-binding LysM domain-containing protein [Thalictrum thalictroides]|uniref:Peptidoglycan-binding LysM domain-containing protein n=1 Tax=Thalictrum thalictroides TaxID=46969 RepID=A0A7J6UUD1_THATH|nr:peptidoglycan-binding LysM domain-containing protein [Thalictrum thalictroides]